MPENITEQLIDRGLLGIAVVAFAVVIIYLWRDGKSDRTEFLRQLNEAHEKRLADAQAVQAQMLDVIKECTTTMAVVSSAIDKQREASQELRTTLREFGEEVRSMGDEVRKRAGGR